ncbi:hypothetical protein SORBI_3001G056900 [Sorghum bicolor]|uniref:Uncharacterized protein n=1 Tax=Sorghum bicolor TaxID=4558 RepID=A0A1B6QHG8_SORBI|nr:hypothetical protein SORBI_3001G056900 [Sorghum bicolor]
MVAPSASSSPTKAPAPPLHSPPLRKPLLLLWLACGRAAHSGMGRPKAIPGMTRSPRHALPAGWPAPPSLGQAS